MTFSSLTWSRLSRAGLALAALASLGVAEADAITTAPVIAPGPVPALAQARTAAPAASSPRLAQARPVADVASRRPAAQRRRPARRKTPRRARPASASLATIAQANAQARDWPSPAAYVNSALYYDFEPGRLYTIHTSPRFLTTITLKPGEKLISKAAGDTVRWVIGETQAGAGEAVQVVIFVKPIRPDLRTNIVLTTDQRTYLIDAVSTASAAYTSVLSWNYPQDLAKEVAAERARLASQPAVTVAQPVPVERLNFRYRIKTIKAKPPAWTPVRVFDDGTRTYIQFPADLATREAPPLFLLGDKDQAELVNYRQSGVYYVVDRLIDRAELRLGAKRQTVVRILREGAAS
ncbi:P-type conjugative transfer protein TrbG [Caulobacter hibisci]|uniref:P-type conjugative transfer protein TrbG n=1 Tax=Caulobacter hibisci TaxID=2035993 RepID=A0ABS0SXR0_9CAUL|nr:P-type conjugative transfer protein TrbG [Caulobacter hibisci]MBI1684209.1 P-type conjugative transfer protein TrbG [Caulobacter hibisci]